MYEYVHYKRVEWKKKKKVRPPLAPWPTDLQTSSFSCLSAHIRSRSCAVKSSNRRRVSTTLKKKFFLHLFWFYIILFSFSTLFLSPQFFSLYTYILFHIRYSFYIYPLTISHLDLRSFFLFPLYHSHCAKIIPKNKSLPF